MDPVIRTRRGAIVRRLLLLALCWSAMAGVTFRGCTGLFTPAIPEPPTSKPVIPNYRSPNLTLNTMEDAIAAKALGSSAWLGAFADSSGPAVPGYHHFFDEADVREFEGACVGCQAPSDWGWSQEQQFFLQFLSVRPSDNYVAFFDSVETRPDPPEGDTETTLHRRYRVLATSPDETSTLIIATGFADLTFTKVTGDNWVITRWNDFRDPDANPLDPYQLSMGRLRLEASR